MSKMRKIQHVAPLSGFRVIELAGIGPGPYCGQLLSDVGAEVIVVDRPGAGPSMLDSRGKKSIVLDIHKPDAVEAVLKLVETSDVLIEGYRLGVTERLGLGPITCQERNPRLVYGRMTGWGQDGPWSSMAGHDINYLSITGFLHMVGNAKQPPPPPINLVGDYGGSSLFLVMGILSALLKAEKTGLGDIIDAAIVDGVSSMLGIVHALTAFGQWPPERDNNILDGGAPFYRCYETVDGKFMAVGCIEAKFFAEMLEILHVTSSDYGNQNDKSHWTRQHDLLEVVFRTKTRNEWEGLFEGTDACVTPVLTLDEAQIHLHNQARKSHTRQDNMIHPGVAPRFATSGSFDPGPLPQRGEDTVQILESIGLNQDTITALTS